MTRLSKKLFLKILKKKFYLSLIYILKNNYSRFNYKNHTNFIMKQKNTPLTKFFILLAFFISQMGNAQTVSGTIKDGKTNEALFGATVVIKGTTQGGLTDMDGKFNFTATTPPPFVLSISYLGYVTVESTVNSIETPITIKIKPNETILKTVEVIGDRITEKQKESPLTIEALDVLAIKETPAANFYEGLGQ